MAVATREVPPKSSGEQPVYRVKLLDPSKYPQQERFIRSKAKRKVVRAGRRGGKTSGISIDAGEKFVEGKRILYTAPTSTQTEAFWFEIKCAFRELIDAKVVRINETEKFIEWTPGFGPARARIKAKTAWNADTMRGDLADVLIFDEYQLTNEDAWEKVGAPMLMDNNGEAIFIYTPPSLLSAGVSKARDPLHAPKMFKAAEADKSGLWETFHFTSLDNPFISQKGLKTVVKDMSKDDYRHEILAEDDDANADLLVYKMFDERTQIIDPIDVKPFPVYVWHDFGQANPAALFTAQNHAGDIFIFHLYLPGPGKSVLEHVEAFQKITAGMTVTRRVGGNPNSEDEIRQGYALAGWPIKAPYWKEPKKQMQVVFSLMERNRIFVFRNCVPLLEELRNCLWETDKDGYRLDKVAHEARYHLLAALRYGASEFPVQVNSPGHEKPNPRYHWKEREGAGKRYHWSMA